MTKKIDDISKRAKGSFFQDVAQRSEKDNWQTPLWLFQGLDSYLTLMLMYVQMKTMLWVDDTLQKKIPA